MIVGLAILHLLVTVVCVLAMYGAFDENQVAHGFLLGGFAVANTFFFCRAVSALGAM